MADEGQQLPDYYALLGIGFDASDDELRRAWREAVKRWHPDTNRSPDAHRMMASVNEAWEVLGNPERKARYDREYHQHRGRQTGQNRRRSRRAEGERSHHQRQAGSTGQSSGSGQDGGSRRQRDDRRARRERERRGRKTREEEGRRRQTEEELRRREEELRRREEEMFKREDEARRERERKRRIEEQKARTARERENLRQRQRSGPGFISRHFRCVGWVVLMSLVGVVWLLTTYGEDWSEYLSNLGDVIAFADQTPPPVATATAFPENTHSASPTPGSPPENASELPGWTYWPAALPTPATNPANQTNEIATRALWGALSDRPAREEVEYLIGLGADVSEPFGPYLNMFDYAVGVGLGSSIVQLLSAGVRPKQATQSLWSILDWGNHPQHELVVYLIGLGADVTGTDQRGRTMFERSLSEDYETPIVQLFSAILSIDEATRGLWAALSRGTTRAEVEHYVGFGADVTALNSGGQTMLEYATDRGYKTPVLQSLSDGSSVETVTNTLWLVLRRGTTPVEVAELIRRGADVTGTDAGYAKVQHAVRTGADDAIVQLLSDEVSVDAATKALWSRLYSNENRPTLDEIVYLLGLGIDVSIPDSNGRTMYEYAVSQNHETFVVQLLSAFLSEEAATAALWNALYRGTTGQEVEYYLCQGADVFEPNLNLETMLNYAEARGMSEDVREALSATCQMPRSSPVPLPTETPPPTFRATATPWPLTVPLETETPVAFPASTPSTITELRLPQSGRLHQNADDGYLGCPHGDSEPGFISSDAVTGRVEFGFNVPDASDWSVGLMYHDQGQDRFSITYVFRRSSDRGIRVGHWTRVGGEWLDATNPVAVVPGIFDTAIGAVNKFAIRTIQDGTEVQLNDRFVFRVPVSQWRPVAGDMRVCVGFLISEPNDYHIDYHDLRAWAE